MADTVTAAAVNASAVEECIERWGLHGRLVMVNPTILIATSSISLVLALLILISYFSVKLLQRQPNSLIAFKAFYDLMYSAMLLLSALHTPGGVVDDDGCFCEDNAWVGVLTQFALIGTEMCLFCLSLDLIFNIRSPFTNFTLQNWVYRVLITVVPAGIAICYHLLRAGDAVSADADAAAGTAAAAATQQLELRTGRWFMGFCLLSYRIDRGVNVLLFFTLVTLGIIFVFSAFASIQSIVRIRRHGRTSHGRDIFKARSHVLRLSLQYLISQVMYWAVAWVTYLLIFFIIGQKSSIINELAGAESPDNLTDEAALAGVELLKAEEDLDVLANLAASIWALHSLPLFGIWVYDGVKVIKLRKQQRGSSDETLFLAPKTNSALRQELVQYLRVGITHLSINSETDVNLMGKCRLDFGNESGGSLSRLKAARAVPVGAAGGSTAAGGRRKKGYTVNPVSYGAAAAADTKSGGGRESKSGSGGGAGGAAPKPVPNFTVRVDKDDAKYAAGNIWEFFKERPVGETRASVQSYDERLFRIMRKTFFKDESLYYKSMNTLTTTSPINDPNDLDSRFCFLTADERLTVQTLTKAEFDCLRQIMIPNIVSNSESVDETDKSYPEYMMDNSKSLLQRYLGCYSVRLLDYNHTIYIGVTANALPPTGTVQEIYTLTGATKERNAAWPAPGTKCVCRHCSARFVMTSSVSISGLSAVSGSGSSPVDRAAREQMECPVNRTHEPQRVLLDNDFRLKVILSPYDAANTLKQLERDTAFLNTEGRVCFGLTLGVSRNRYPIANGMSPVIKLQQSHQALTERNGHGGTGSNDAWEGVHRSQAYEDYVTNSAFSRNAVIADARTKVAGSSGGGGGAGAAGGGAAVVQEPVLSTIVEGPSTYHMSVTEILDRWTLSDSVWYFFQKMFTRQWKAALKISPEQYRSRFMKFAREKMIDTLRKHAEIRCLGPDKRPRRLTLDLNDIHTFQQFQQCVATKKFTDMMRRSGVPELSAEDLASSNTVILRTAPQRARQLFDAIKSKRPRSLSVQVKEGNQAHGIAVFDFTRPDRPLGWREERQQALETKEMEEAAALSILDDLLSRRQRVVLSRFVNVVKDRLYEANLTVTLDDLLFPKVDLARCVEELREPRELYEQARKVREYGKTATQWLRGMQDLVADFNHQLRAAGGGGGGGGASPGSALSDAPGSRSSMRSVDSASSGGGGGGGGGGGDGIVSMPQRLNRMLYVTLLVDGGIKNRAATGLDQRRMKAENLSKKAHKALMRDLDPLIRSVIMNKRFLQLALRMVEYSTLTLERVDLSKRIDSVRRIVAEAVEMTRVTPDFDVAALPDPTPEQTEFAQQVVAVADRVRRVLVEVVRLEREHPIQGMLSLVDQEHPPPRRRLSDVAVQVDQLSSDEDDEFDDVEEEEVAGEDALCSPRQFRRYPKHLRKGMYFRQRALSTMGSRRSLQKIYNLEAIASPMHIPSDLLAPYFKYWRRKYSQTMSFQRFLFICPFLSSTQMKDLAVNNLSLFTQIMCEKGMSNGIPSGVQVRYLRNARHRRQYEAILCEGGFFIDHEGRPFDTAEMESNFSGRGFGICSFCIPQHEFILNRRLTTMLSRSGFRTPSDGLFLGTHRVRHFHHSTFFGGQTVDFAGEMQFEEGHLRVVTNKSGHYKPGDAEILVMLNWLHTNGVDLSDVEFRSVHDVPEDSDEHFVTHNAEELRLRLEAEAADPEIEEVDLELLE